MTEVIIKTAGTTETFIVYPNTTETIVGIPGPQGPQGPEGPQGPQGPAGPDIGVVNAVDDFGAKGDGVTDDYPAIQAALDAVGAKGGGKVFLPKGTYYCTQVISVPSHTELYGVGFDTVIINPPDPIPSKNIAGVNFNATIASAGTVGARVSRLTVDRSQQGDANGIQFGEAGANAPTTDGVVEHCQVLGRNIHQYNIYVKLADRMKIRNNVSKGPINEFYSQDVAGIEIFGSNDTEVSGNVVSRCSAGIIVKTENILEGNSSIKNVAVHSNMVDDCNNGISISVTDGTDVIGENIMVHNNVVTNCANRGLVINLAANSVSNNLAITENVTRNCPNGAVVIDSDPLAQSKNFALIGNTIVQDDPNLLAHGLNIFDAKDVVITNNIVTGTPKHSIYISASSDLTVTNNSLISAKEEAIIMANSPSGCRIIGNTIVNWGTVLARVGISATGDGHTFTNNFFNPSSNSSNQYAIRAQNATNCEISDNRLGYNTANGAFVNGTGGRNNYGTAIWDRNSYLVSAIFPRAVGFSVSNDEILTDAVQTDGTLRLRSPVTISSANAPGERGQIRWDGNYIYVCVAANTWKRVALSGW